MIIGSMKEVFLTRAMDIFLFDCRVADMDAQALNMYRHVLESFIRFTGDVRVKHLTPDHIGLYVANLSDGPYESDEHDLMVESHFDIIQTWIHWMYAQKYINERTSGSVRPPRLTTLFPVQSARRLAWCV